MKKNLFLLLALLALVLTAQAQTQTITVGGTQRSYISYVPQNLGQRRPLLISCHGMNQDANYQRNMLKIESVADTAKFVTVFPEGQNKMWDIGGNSDINFILALIDEMVVKYDVDPGRVYLSGFSMGGMFTYHAMNRISDRIAAFAPISGYTMGGVTASQSARAIPIIHTHGTGDDVVTFANVQQNLNVWIQHDGLDATPKTVKNYRGTPHITRHTWGPSADGIEVVLMELADKGHWIANDYGVLTGEEIWNFCSRYRIDVEWPRPTKQLEGYLNSQPADQWCSFILGLTQGNGEDVKNGAVWDIQHVADRGFTLRNVGTGLYLRDAAPARYDEPAYFTFCTLKAADASGIEGLRLKVEDLSSATGVYDLQGRRVNLKSQTSNLKSGLYIVGGRKVVVK